MAPQIQSLRRALKSLAGVLFLLLSTRAGVCTSQQQHVAKSAQPKASPKTKVGTSTAKPKQGPPSDLGVVDLTSTDFSSNIGDGNRWLIEFWSPSCRHCREFASSYSMVAATFHSSPSEGIRVAKVDISTEKALKARFDIHAVPSFLVVDGWSVYLFEGYYSEAKLIEFVREGYKLQDPVPFLLSPMGPMGQLQGAILSTGGSMMKLFDTFQGSYGLPPIAAAVSIGFSFFILGMIGIVLLVLVTTPKAKID